MKSQGRPFRAALRLAGRPEHGGGGTIAALLPDGGGRDLSTPLFAD